MESMSEVVSEEWWEIFLKSCGPTLETLRGVVVARGGATGTLRSIALHCSNLRELEIGRGFNMTVADMIHMMGEVIQRCAQLQSVACKAETYGFFAWVVARMGTRLRHFEYTAECTSDAANIDECVYECTNLRTLRITNEYNGVIEDETLKIMADRCPHMEELGVNYLCPWKVTDAAAFALADRKSVV
jgi:hypothetical protein